jgi:eukaryotic-like serine/threonine-protein kinase
MAIEELQDGRYRRSRLLGSGGMGEVYLMQDTRVSRQVAIKVTRSEGAPYPESNTASDAARLFQREARAIAALEHPHILPLYDFGEETRESASITYMVMPFCADGSLQEWMSQRGDRMLPPQNVAYLVDQAAEALQYAHDHEVIHLDVKPSNFLLRTNKRSPDRPTLLLADFGIARNFTTVASSSRTIRGTPTAMAPEQWSSEPVFSTDQYALAVMAYEMLAGRLPFIGSMEQLMYQHFNTQAPPPSTFNPRLSDALDAVLLRALSKKPEDRFPSITEFASALVAAVQQLPSAPVDQAGGAIENYATLAISQAEAESGISRMITLPGGKQVNVPIPPGVRDGQVIHLAPSADDPGETVGVALTIAIKQSDRSHAVQEAASAGQARNTPPIHTPPISVPQPQQSAAVAVSHDGPTVAAAAPGVTVPVTPPVAPRKRSSGARLSMIALISVFVVIVLIAGTVAFYLSHQSGSPNALSTHQTPTVTVKLSPTTPATVAVTPSPGLYIAGTYNGSMFDETTNQTNSISVFLMQTQGYAPLKGSVTFRSPTQGNYQLSGAVDTQGKFSFTMQQSVGQTPLYFFGTIQQNSQGTFLHGYFCHSGTGSCQSSTGTGYFTVGPKF